MTTESLDERDDLSTLRASHGGFAMVALDQRESLRRMFPVVNGAEVGDDTLRAFKQEAIAILSQHASAVLLDRPYGLGADPHPPLAPGCTLIVAADDIEQPPGMPIVDTALDPLVTVEYVQRAGAAAVKLLVIWRDDGSQARREDLVRSFVAFAREAAVSSLVEGVVQPASGDGWRDAAERHTAILRAAQELGSYGGSIYKAEVPGYVPGDVSGVREQAQRLTAALDVPWVVLSNGVERADFADAAREAVRGGASGFLAGRAIWADTVAEPDLGAALRDRSVGRLSALDRIVAQERTTQGSA
jgi:sulfofructosephosphate aldolase